MSSVCVLVEVKSSAAEVEVEEIKASGGEEGSTEEMGRADSWEKFAQEELKDIEDEFA